MKVSQVMRTEVITVAPEASLKEVAAMLAERGISGLPVVDANGTVVGVVSEADILMKQRTPAPPPRRGVLSWLLSPQPAEVTSKLDARTAGDAMTSPAITVDPETNVARAAALMVEQAINRLPVVYLDRLVGIVTRADLVRAFARSDAEIQREIAEDVVLKQFWLPPDTVSVGVSHGDVTLAGELERRSVAELLASFVERVPGVLSVESRLSWREDDRI